MNELIPVAPRQIGTGTVLSSEGRDLHTFLNVGKDFSTWIKDRIDQYGFIEGEDFATYLLPNIGEKGQGRPTKEYILSLNMARELSMVERTPKGKEARLYYIECERRVIAGETAPAIQPEKSASQSGLPEFRRARALDMAAKTAERIVAQFPSLSEQSRQVVFAKVINPVAGIEILALPRMEQKHLSAGEIGEKLGVSSAMVGRIANAHGLKTEEYGMYLLDKSKYSSKQVETFVYNDKGAEAIKFFLEAEKIAQMSEQKRISQGAPA